MQTAAQKAAKLGMSKKEVLALLRLHFEDMGERHKVSFMKKMIDCGYAKASFVGDTP
jgi:hypothetical protein